MKQVVKELNATEAYVEQYNYLYKALADVTLENLLELLVLVERDYEAGQEEKDTVLGVINSEIMYRFNER